MMVRYLLQITFFFLFACPLGASLVYVSDPRVTVDNENLTFKPIPWNLLPEQEAKKQSFWFRDCTKQQLDEQHLFLFEKVLAIGQTPFQSYAFIDATGYGKILFIDGEVQSSQQDEFIYHESLVHPAMIAHPCPKSVLVIGAGEGAAAREILRHSSVERLVLVDIDGEIVQKCKDLLIEWHQGAFDHPKVELLIMDGKAYVESGPPKFDIIYIDICDKLDHNLVAELYTEAFYSSLKEILNPNGIVVVQAMEFDARISCDHLIVHDNLQRAFSFAVSSGVYVPSFWAMWGFVIASDSPCVVNLNAEKVDAILETRGLTHQLRHYDGETHRHMYSLSKELRQKLKDKKPEEKCAPCTS
jgi:spermidine synthase